MSRIHRRRIGHLTGLVLLGFLLAGLTAMSALGAEEKPADGAAKPEPAKTEPSKTEPAKPETPPAAAQPEPAKPETKPAAPSPEAAKPAAPAAKPAAEKPEAEKSAELKSHTVKEGPFKLELNLRGTLEGQSWQPVQVRLQEWKILEVRKAVAHGSRVRQGDVLVEFNVEDLDKLIADMKSDQRLSELTLKQTEETLRALEAAAPLDLERARRSHRIVEEDRAFYEKFEKPMTEKNADMSLKMAQESLANSEEELRQLEKMYKADEVTEETEEIILRRQRTEVEMGRFYLEMAKLRNQYAKTFGIPRVDESIKTETAREALSLRWAEFSVPTALSRQKIELEKLQVAQQRSADRLKRLEADREALKVVAATDGIVYYGEFANGEWSGASTAADRLKPGGTITSGDVFLTVVRPAPLLVRAPVAEKDLRWFKEGLAAVVEPTLLPDVRLAGAVDRVDAIPTADNKFEALFRLTTGADPLVPGMTCGVKVIPYQVKDAVTVPAAAVFTDETDDEQKYVYLVAEPGKYKRVTVKLGQKQDDRVEITRGLRDGDKILLEKPKDEAAK